MKTIHSPAWKPCTTTVERNYHGQGGSGRQQVVVILGTPKRFGACIKFTPAKDPDGPFLANVHVYTDGAGNPAASAFFEDGYPAGDPVFDLVSPRQVVAGQAEMPDLGVVLGATAPDAHTILDALWRHRGALPEKLSATIAELFTDE